MNLRFEDSAQGSLPPAGGMLLLSEPFLLDPNFNRTVVLLTEHNQQGTIGFVLNRPIELEIKDVLPVETILEIPLFYGGPVQNNTLHFIHRDASLAGTSARIGDDIYWGGDFDEVQRRIEENTLKVEDFRFFLGYSGWGAGQLDEELESGSWIVTLATRPAVFEMDKEKMWRHILNDMGGAYRVLANSPENPQMN
jgi:putative transcriptional regulator